MTTSAETHMSETPALATPATFDVVSPVTGEVTSREVAMTPAEATDRVRAAADAQRAWAGTTHAERRNLLLRAADLLEREAEGHIATMMMEVGATRPWAEMNIHETVATLREAAAVTSSPTGEFLPSAIPGVTNHSLREPAGVSLSIVPWNAPLILAARSSLISLALGNAVVVRPSEESPVSAGHLLAGVLSRAGLDPSLFAVVTSAPEQGKEVIGAMVDAPDVRRVVFIGSTPVGRAIAARAGAALTPCVLELGGKNATIVRADADLGPWIPQLAFASFANTGQVCMCTDRLLVHRSRFEEIVEGLARHADHIVVGDPREATTDIGPLINQAAVDRFHELVRDATANGGTIVAGGTADGLYARPTVLTDVSESCRYFGEEGFAPIVSITPFEHDDEAVQLVNSNDYGLIGSIVGEDRHACYSLAQRMHAGAVHVNGPSVGDEPHVPFGGLGASGMGRLGGTSSIDFFTEQRTFYVRS